MTGEDGSRRILRRVTPTTALIVALLAVIQIVNAVTRSHDTAPDEQAIAPFLDAVDPVVLSTTPKSGPKAGKAFVVRPVRLNLRAGEAPASGAPRPDRYSCLALIGDRLVSGSGAGGCTLRIAPNARGRTLSVVVSASYRGATMTFPFEFVVS